MIETVNCSFVWQKDVGAEAPFSPYVKITFVATGSLAFLVSLLIFYRIPGLNNLGTTKGWVFFTFGAVTFGTGITVKWRKIEKPIFRPFDLVTDEILIHIFSYLKSEDHKNVEKVSERWERCLNDEKLNKSKCLKAIDHPKPSTRSWKNHHEVLLNWIEGKFKISNYPTKSPIAWRAPQNFTLLEDGSIFDISHRFRMSNSYTIRNVSTTRIWDGFAINSVEIVGMAFYGKIWAVQDYNRNISCFNFVTSDYPVHFFSLPEEDEEDKRSLFQAIYCNQDEVISYNAHKIVICSFIKKEPTVIKCEDKISSLFSTPNFVRITTDDNRSICINKNGLATKQIDEGTILATSGSYLALFTESEGLKIYKDVETELKLLSKIEMAEHPTNIQIFKNWVLINQKGLLKVWNADTGYQITEFLLPAGEMRINFDKLVVQTVNEENNFFSYILYDFLHGVKESPVEEELTSNHQGASGCEM